MANKSSMVFAERAYHVLGELSNRVEPPNEQVVDDAGNPIITVHISPGERYDIIIMRQRPNCQVCQLPVFVDEANHWQYDSIHQTDDAFTNMGAIHAQCFEKMVENADYRGTYRYIEISE